MLGERKSTDFSFASNYQYFIDRGFTIRLYCVNLIFNIKCVQAQLPEPRKCRPMSHAHLIHGRKYEVF